ncbi:DUF2244 domain-containing protein [Enterovirga rhinocerotis]|uniref:Putative membrane protein n=1 Tax=Enterovirga rhinocerotis TaxID=1339210 RepID=A0A4R7C783_9HYPH|nr:DUF2244 domain-containing protein [Enterovirga rhinocerotis]TDR93832.1 putative membrane protein [Enterovirga rhinocerotis]
MSAGNPDLPGEMPGSSAAAVFAATITPHRSLGPEGFRVMMVVLSVVAAMMALRFVSLGFWPVSGFIGLDILALYIAFKVSYRRGRAFEEIRLTPVELRFRRVSHRGEEREWRLNPLWTRLVRETHEEFGLQRLALVSRGERIVIAQELSPDERAHFADEFGRALMQVKSSF